MVHGLFGPSYNKSQHDEPTFKDEDDGVVVGGNLFTVFTTHAVKIVLDHCVYILYNLHTSQIDLSHIRTQEF